MQFRSLPRGLQSGEAATAIRRGMLPLAVVLILLLPAVSAGSTGTVPVPDAQVLAVFAELQAHVLMLAPPLNPGQRVSLSAKLRNAEADYRAGRPCTALNVLRAFMNETQALRRGSLVAAAEELYAGARLLRLNLAARLPSDMRCAPDEAIEAGLSVQVLESDNTHVRGRITFGEPGMASVAAAGETFTRVTVAGSAPVGEPGLPGVPVVNRLVAVPRGAQVLVSASAPVVAEAVRINLYPFQPEPADQDVQPFDPFGDRPFVKDAEAYASPGPFPPATCTVRPLGQLRDLPIAQLSCAAGRYDPLTDTLTLFRSVDFDVRFDGGSGYFVTHAALMPFELPIDQLLRRLLNEKDVQKHVDPIWLSGDCTGEELLIIAHENLKEPAEGLASWKRAKGIATSVVTVGSSTTASAIDNYIDHRYDHCTVRPSYVLLMGDAELVPTFYVASEFAPQTGSDYRYGAAPEFLFDILPHFAVGRIPVDTPGQGWDVVNKIVHYESEPPMDVAFYENVSVASQFQCCRSDQSLGEPTYPGQDMRAFIETSEGIRDALLGQGYAVERIYTKTVEDDYWKTGKDQVPSRYYSGTLLPADLGKGSGFAWNGTKDQIAQALNQGRFLFMHRDHGSWNGWTNPGLTKDDVADSQFLHNGDLLPVVFSMNCSTGLFDNESNPSGARGLNSLPFYYPYGPGVQEDTYFAERLLRRADGGAVGVIAATRDSPSWANNALTRGLFDAVWPGTVPGFGTQASTRRLGDMLNYAKLYTFTEMAAPGASFDADPLTDVLSELYLWHVIGDPTLEMWTSRPATLPFEHAPAWHDGALHVEYSVEGATITALQTRSFPDADMRTTEMRPLGRAQVKDGVAVLHLVLEPWNDVPIRLSACAPGGICRQLSPSRIE